MSLMRPDRSGALSCRFVGTLRLSTQRSRKNFLLMLLVLAFDAIALLYAKAECQQKAIVPFFNVDASGERCWKKCDTSYWQYYLNITFQDKNMLPWSQRFFLNFPCVREPRSGEKEKPLVTLDLNLTFKQTLGS